MIDVKSRWNSVADKERWRARGASFVAKAKATKVVWFPPKPAESGRKLASTTKKTAKKTAGKARKPAKKTAGAAKKTSASAKKAAS
jgi:hypothetical protein